MDTYKAIFSRHTVREFNNEPIPNDVLKKILLAGLQAPSNDHLRNWEFIILDDSVIRENAIAVIEEMSSETDIENLLIDWGINGDLQKQMYFNAIPKQKSMLRSASKLILPLFKQEVPLLQPRSLSSLNAHASIWCCIENILIAAAVDGIYGVTRIPMQNETEHLRELLNIPNEYEFACYLALGYPSENLSPVKQYEQVIEKKIHLNHW